jgi:hypothetical protein
VHCRRNVRKLIEEYRRRHQPIARTRRSSGSAMRSLLSRLLRASSLRRTPQADRHDDYVYIHQQSMARHPPGDPRTARRAPRTHVLPRGTASSCAACPRDRIVLPRPRANPWPLPRHRATNALTTLSEAGVATIVAHLLRDVAA